MCSIDNEVFHAVKVTHTCTWQNPQKHQIRIRCSRIHLYFLFRYQASACVSYMYGPRREKTCLRHYDKASFKPVSSATETG